MKVYSYFFVCFDCFSKPCSFEKLFSFFFFIHSSLFLVHLIEVQKNDTVGFVFSHKIIDFFISMKPIVISLFSTTTPTHTEMKLNVLKSSNIEKKSGKFPLVLLMKISFSPVILLLTLRIELPLSIKWKIQLSLDFFH